MPNYAAPLNGKDTRFQPQGQPLEAIAPKPTNTKHYLRVWVILKRIPTPAAYVRDAVLAKMIEDGLLPRLEDPS